MFACVFYLPVCCLSFLLLLLVVLVLFLLFLLFAVVCVVVPAAVVAYVAVVLYCCCCCCCCHVLRCLFCSQAPRRSEQEGTVAAAALAETCLSEARPRCARLLADVEEAAVGAMPLLQFGSDAKGERASKRDYRRGAVVLPLPTDSLVVGRAGWVGGRQGGRKGGLEEKSSARRQQRGHLWVQTLLAGGASSTAWTNCL